MREDDYRESVQLEKQEGPSIVVSKRRPGPGNVNDIRYGPCGTRELKKSRKEFTVKESVKKNLEV